MAYRTIFVCQWSWLVVVVDEVRHRGELATVSRTVYPVIDDVVDEVEDATPANAWVTTRVVSPQITHKGGVLATNGRAKGVVPCVEGLCRDGVLNRYIDSWFLAVRLAVLHVEHVAIERDILVQSPFARTMVNHDVTHRVATKRVLTVGYQRLATTETHVTNDDIVGINLERLASNDDTIARSRLSCNSNIRSTHVDGRLQADDT